MTCREIEGRTFQLSSVSFYDWFISAQYDGQKSDMDYYKQRMMMVRMEAKRVLVTPRVTCGCPRLLIDAETMESGLP